MEEKEEKVGAKGSRGAGAQRKRSTSTSTTTRGAAGEQLGANRSREERAKRPSEKGEGSARQITSISRLSRGRRRRRQRRREEEEEEEEEEAQM